MVGERYCEETCKWQRKSDDYCEKCPRPGILPGNKEIWALFMLCSTQLRFSFGGVAGFDYLAVQWVADKHGINIDSAMLTKLQAIEHAFIDAVNEKETE